MDEKEVCLRCRPRLYQVPPKDTVGQKALVNESIFDNREDMGPDVRIVAIGVDK
jgi:hypothetical protein